VIVSSVLRILDIGNEGGARMSIRRKRQIIRKNAAISGRQAVADPFRPRPTKTELREQAVEAVASYEGPITRCAPKRRRSA
jgi:hypothetical protein